MKFNTKSTTGVYTLEKVTIIALISKLYFMGFTNSAYSSYNAQVYLIMQLLILLLIGLARDIKFKAAN